MAELSPMMKQYIEIKKEHEDAILMFRLGDFYEMFFEDAKTASRELELVLTGRDCGREERAPMCGVPFHSADSYIARLVAKGYKVAICEQMEDPALAKGIVRRDVVRIITPGTVIESSMLDESKNNYLAGIFCKNGKAGVCFADVSTGILHLTQIDTNADTKISDELGRFMPTEIIYNRETVQYAKVRETVEKRLNVTAQELEEGDFSYSECVLTVLRHFKAQTLDELGIGGASEAVCALGAVLGYLSSAQKTELENIRNIDFYSDAQFMKLQLSSRRNLELTETMRSREKKGALLWVLDKTKSPMGKRLMRSMVEQPLINLARITKRHNAVGELVDKTQVRNDVTLVMKSINDIERLMARIVYKTANPKEMKALEQTLRQIPLLKDCIRECKSSLLTEIYSEMDELEDVAKLIYEAIVDENPPFSVREGGMIKKGYNSELDSLVEIRDNCKDYLAKIQLSEQEKTGIKKLKIGYNRVFGYYIEVSNSFKELVPETYIRKQTLTGCERYITQELKELESKALGAQERIVSLEYEIFCNIREATAKELLRIQKTAQAIAKLDVFCSLANTAVEGNYCCPEMTTDGRIEIKGGRHPVVEKMLTDAPFVPNDTLLDSGDNRCAIITGPNMAGKSTYMRQTALIVLMAQIGSFVPADSATISIVDSIFTRVGASDDLASGQSTFMVEMSEVASILKEATSNSLIIFDEIGRGTSTFDGMSIAKAVLEYAVDKKKLGAKTLFATHYHELTELENEINGVKNYNIAVKKRGDDITFLRRIVRGGADGSYGIEVAKLAGVPSGVVNRAKVILRNLEEQGTNISFNSAQTYVQEQEESVNEQISFVSNGSDAIIEKLKNTDINTLTPIEAMTVLYELVKNANSL